MTELLLEIFSEEMPASMQQQAETQLQMLLVQALNTRHLAFERLECWGSPRRLGAIVYGLPPHQPDMAEDKRGPRVQAPIQAIQGFASSLGLSTADLIAEGEYWFARYIQHGQETSLCLQLALQEVLHKFTWPKTMRWGTGSFRWVRPIRNILAFFNGQSILLKIEGLPVNEKIYESTGSLSSVEGENYKKKLQAQGVILSRTERARIIRKEARALAHVHKVEWREDASLLEEVVGLAESPAVLMGRIDEEFMHLPAELLMTVMKKHQRYFGTLQAGKLAPYFIFVSNTQATDGGHTIIRGNERVLRARLSDARFFYDTDRKRPLKTYRDQLKSMLFKKELGTLADKVERIKKLSVSLNTLLKMGFSVEHMYHAADLIKADLGTGLVREFPELQGVMGAEYARLHEEPQEIASAIQEHYKPLGPDGPIPYGSLSILMALSDKIDTLVGFFGIQQIPTGSRDPFALRRAASGVLRIIRGHQLRFDLRAFLEHAYESYGPFLTCPGNVTVESVFSFFLERLKILLQEEGIAIELIEASIGPEIIGVFEKVDALKSFVDTPQGQRLLAGYRRACNILRVEEKRDGCLYSHPPFEEGLEPIEQEFIEACREAEGLLQKELHHSHPNYSWMMEVVAGLQHPVDKFFECITVNSADEKIRRNRLNMLGFFRKVAHYVADFSRIPKANIG